MKRLGYALVLLLAGGVHAQAGLEVEQAQSLTARAMMEKYREHFNNQDESTEMEMTLASKSGSQRMRRLSIKTLRIKEGLEKILIRFQAPADIRGTSLLTWEQRGRSDDQWLYLPALHKTKRIAGADKNKSFVGSDLSYEDLRPEKLDDHHYTKVGENENSYLIEAMPRPTANSGYGKRRITLRKDNFFAIAVDYFDKKGELLKSLHAFQLITVDRKRVRANRIEVKNVRTGHGTILKVISRLLNTGLTDRHFTRRDLERGI